MTLLADYGLRNRVWIPSGAIVALLMLFRRWPWALRLSGFLDSLAKDNRFVYKSYERDSTAPHVQKGTSSVTGVAGHTERKRRFE